MSDQQLFSFAEEEPIPNTLPESADNSEWEKERKVRRGVQHISEPLRKILQKLGLSDEEVDPKKPR